MSNKANEIEELDHLVNQYLSAKKAKIYQLIQFFTPFVLGFFIDYYITFIIKIAYSNGMTIGRPLEKWKNESHQSIGHQTRGPLV